MAGCSPACGFCGACTEAWERDVDEFEEPDLPALFRDNDRILAAVRAEQSSDDDDRPCPF